MNFLELSDYSLAASGSGSGIRGFSFSLGPGEVCAIDSFNPDDAQTFMRALATLVRPIEGIYRFKGRTCDLKDPNAMLSLKKQIGYVARDAALISNLTVRQNLLLQRCYFENRLDIDLHEDVEALCSTFGIQDKLDQRPAGLNVMEVQAAIIVREMTKKPEFMIMGQPESIGHAKFGLLTQIFNRMIAERLPIVLLSYDLRLVRRFANRKILIADGSLSTLSISDPSAVEWNLTRRYRPARRDEPPGASILPSSAPEP
ncbi:MAG: ATP-binding cassette domain-containing protein [Desulfobacteraceae bacterium]|nr:MAG: ATP-binding cassette domain-containing protein [Desulfobacteraceae bacterium]